MKFNNLYILIVLGFFSILSCRKESTSANISTITYFPELTLNGDRWNVVNVGGTWTDPGAKAFEGTNALTPTVSGSVDVTKPGVYTIEYTAVNKDGYSASEFRYVGVISAATLNGDISGNYKRNAGAQGVAVVTKIKNGLYYSNNVGGVATPDPSLGVYFYHYDTGKLGVPFQKTPGNAFECINSTVDVGVKYSWVVINSGYGTALRNFIKQ